jgi:hypothetical protein
MPFLRPPYAKSPREQRAHTLAPREKNRLAASPCLFSTSAGRLNNRCNRPQLTPGMTMVYAGRLTNRNNPLFSCISWYNIRLRLGA